MKYPRVLIVYGTCINEKDQHGMSLRGWFADWPRENLAQIYSSGEVGERRFCGYTFRIGPAERQFGELFYRLKGSLVSDNQPVVMHSQKDGHGARVAPFGYIKQAINKMLLNSGLWELLFKPRISTDLIGWVREFRPDIIYCQGYSLTFSLLPILLKNEFSLPLCFQTGDDWPMDLYTGSIFSWIMCPIVHRYANKLIGISDIKLSNGPGMSQAYLSRYGVFEPLMLCDDFKRYREAMPKRLTANGTISIVYSGGLGHDRWKSILDLSKAVEELNKSGVKVRITVFSWLVPPEAKKELASFRHLQVCPPPAHDEVPGILKGADILFLSETFVPKEVRKIRLSLSSKAHIYMMSGKPILVYGSPEAGVVNYATNEGWGYVVDRKDPSLLSDAVCQLVRNVDLRDGLVAKAFAVAKKNHDGSTVRERFRILLLGT